MGGLFVSFIYRDPSERRLRDFNTGKYSFNY